MNWFGAYLCYIFLKEEMNGIRFELCATHSIYIVLVGMYTVFCVCGHGRFQNPESVTRFPPTLVVDYKIHNISRKYLQLA